MPKAPEKPEVAEPIKCGIVMPLSECDGCPPSHWGEVQGIIRESLEGTPFKAEMVSEDSVSNILQARIVGNLFKNEMVICDVSGRNPNVMLELGMRLAFNKPVIVIKDEATPYSFDTSPIEHIGYPRSLRFGEIVLFKQRLKEKVMETFEASKKPSYRSFLSHFDQYKPIPGSLSETEASALQIVQEQIGNLRQELYSARREARSWAPFESVDIRFSSPIEVLREIQKTLLQAGYLFYYEPEMGEYDYDCTVMGTWNFDHGLVRGIFERLGVTKIAYIQEKSGA